MQIALQMRQNGSKAIHASKLQCIMVALELNPLVAVTQLQLVQSQSLA